MKTLCFLKKYLIIAFYFISLNTIQGQAELPEGNSVSGRNIPDYKHIPYSTEKPYNILNIYIAEGTKNGPPTPLYVWAHAGGGNLDGFGPPATSELSRAGISAISWASVEPVRSGEDYKQCMNDFEKVMDFVIKNAGKYNFDTNKIVVGGSSRGSFITWEFSHKNPHLVKGIYSTGALGDPAMWKDEVRFLTSRDPRDFIHADSPPLIFVYPVMLGDVDIHSPRSGLLIKEKYDELGIGHRVRVEHSLEKRNLHRWSFIADFITKVTSE